MKLKIFNNDIGKIVFIIEPGNTKSPLYDLLGFQFNKAIIRRIDEPLNWLKRSVTITRLRRRIDGDKRG